MRLDVVFLPALLRRPERSVCIVIDVLRATSTVVTLLAGGAREVSATATIERAFALRDEMGRSGDEQPVLCGEVGGLPPEGFDYGNSPEEFSRLDLRGRRVVLFTSNGTKALVQVAGSPKVIAGSLLNRRAAMRAGFDAASSSALDLTFVCSGTDLGTAFCLEDAFCAGAFVAACRDGAGASLELGDGAETALRLYRSFDGDASAAFHVAEHGRSLAGIGLAADLDFCARSDVYDVAPEARPLGDVVVLR